MTNKNINFGSNTHKKLLSNCDVMSKLISEEQNQLEKQIIVKEKKSILIGTSELELEPTLLLGSYKIEKEPTLLLGSYKIEKEKIVNHIIKEEYKEDIVTINKKEKSINELIYLSEEEIFSSNNIMTEEQLNDLSVDELFNKLIDDFENNISDEGHVKIYKEDVKTLQTINLMIHNESEFKKEKMINQMFIDRKLNSEDSEDESEDEPIIKKETNDDKRIKKEKERIKKRKERYSNLNDEVIKKRKQKEQQTNKLLLEKRVKCLDTNISTSNVDLHKYGNYKQTYNTYKVEYKKIYPKLSYGLKKGSKLIDMVNQIDALKSNDIMKIIIPEKKVTKGDLWKQYNELCNKLNIERSITNKRVLKRELELEIETLQQKYNMKRIGIIN